MTTLPVVSGGECMRALQRADFQLVRRESSHLVLRRADPFAQVTVPDHKEIDRGTLRAIIRQAGMTVDEFSSLLRK